MVLEEKFIESINQTKSKGNKKDTVKIQEHKDRRQYNTSLARRDYQRNFRGMCQGEKEIAS